MHILKIMPKLIESHDLHNWLLLLFRYIYDCLCIYLWLSIYNSTGMQVELPYF